MDLYFYLVYLQKSAADVCEFIMTLFSTPSGQVDSSRASPAKYLKSLEPRELEPRELEKSKKKRAR